ncbi:MAG: glycosyltransferase family 2 protein [Armatimonadetes bacterium]|nr:glycosyltransferase family 2 protein [Armatimonadota bacterium]
METPGVKENPVISVIIPALNEEKAIGKVLSDIPKDLVQEIIVVDNGSTDRTPEIASANGATVLRAPRKGYGSACLFAVQYLERKTPDIVVFVAGDYSDDPTRMQTLVDPILKGEADFVLGSRMLGQMEKGSMTPQSYFGNKLAGFLIRLFFGFTYTDLGPFRAITYEALLKLKMKDQDFGWTVEMQIKALEQNLKILEKPVPYRCRIGKSKVSGTLWGTFMASYKILWTIFRYALLR